MFIEKDVINFSTSKKKKVKMAIKSFISGGNFGNSQEISDSWNRGTNFNEGDFFPDESFKIFFVRLISSKLELLNSGMQISFLMNIVFEMPPLSTHV